MNRFLYQCFRRSCRFDRTFKHCDSIALSREMVRTRFKIAGGKRKPEKDTGAVRQTGRRFKIQIQIQIQIQTHSIVSFTSSQHSQEGKKDFLVRVAVTAIEILN